VIPAGTEKRLSELPSAEVRQVFDRFLAEQPERLAAFTAEVGRRGGPADQLDRSIESLEPLWAWFLGEHRPRRFGGRRRQPRTPATDEQMRSQAPPWWYDFHPQFGQELGPYLARLATGLGDYYFACALEARPTSGWKLEKRRSNAYFQHPVFEIDGRGTLDYAMPIVKALQGLRGEHDAAEPNALRRHLERWLGMDPDWEAEMQRLSRPMGPYAIRPIDAPGFTHEINFDDAIAHRQDRRIDRLVELLSAESGAEAVREDREVVLLKATVEPEELVARLWEQAGRRSHAGPA
jgi:hypothetical protein